MPDSTESSRFSHYLYLANKMGKLPRLKHPAGIPAGRRFRMLLVGLVTIFLIQLGLLLFSLDYHTQAPIVLIVTSILSVIGIALMFALLSTLQRDLIEPSDQLKKWSDAIRAGAISIRLKESEMGELRTVSREINMLMDYLQDISKSMEGEIRRQTAQYEQKNKSLQLLYDVATSINSSRDLHDMLSRFLHTMRDIIHAKAGMVRLLEDGKMNLIASFGIDDDILQQERAISPESCLCGTAILEGKMQFQDNLDSCHKIHGQQIIDDDNLEMVAVPLRHHNNNLGVFNLFIDKQSTHNLEEIMALFSSVGQHLGMAVEKNRLDEESNRLSIIQERNALAHELHDSIAQTLASLKFQVSMLDDSIQQQDIDTSHLEVKQIRGGLDEAYSELRELLAHFRAPTNLRNMLPALEDLISNFRRKTGMHVLLQKDWDNSRLLPTQELQILRIIQESLANIRKHSHAHTVRVLMRCDKQQNYHILIEDDGVGMKRPAFSGHPGEHIGLSIMQERALTLGANFKIESEPEEGTQVELRFHLNELNHNNTPLKTK